MSSAVDVQRMHDSIIRLPEQLTSAWQATRSIRVPASYRDVHHVVVAGMGGSGLAGDIVRSAFADTLAVPLVVVNDYHLPAFAGSKTFVVVASFSGDTEESVAVYREARARRAKRAVITSGGALARMAKDDGVCRYIFDPIANPSGRPRVGGGYMLGGLLGLLQRAELLSLGNEEMTRALKLVTAVATSYGETIPISKNPAKALARELLGKMPVLVSGAAWAGNIHAWANSFNETAKTFSASFTLPELNHHLLEGLGHPREAKRLLRWVGVRPKSGVMEARYTLTKKIVERQGMRWIEAPLIATAKLAQVFELLLLGNIVCYYLALENRENPSPNPWVDYFKKQLAKK